MPGILRKNVDSASSLIIQGSLDVNINGYSCVRIGDIEENGYKMIQGSATVFVNGIGVCRAGDLDNNDVAGELGSSDVFCG